MPTEMSAIHCKPLAELVANIFLFLHTAKVMFLGSTNSVFKSSGGANGGVSAKLLANSNQISFNQFWAQNAK